MPSTGLNGLNSGSKRKGKLRLSSGEHCIMRETNRRLWKTNLTIMAAFLAAMIVILGLGLQWAIIPLLLGFLVIGNVALFRLRCGNCGHPIIKQGIFYNALFARRNCSGCGEPLP